MPRELSDLAGAVPDRAKPVIAQNNCGVYGVMLFRKMHSRRVFGPKVDFISLPGVSAAEVHRRNLSALCLDLCK